MSLRPDPPANPYIGPRAFRAGESLYGREREATQLLNLIVAERIVLLHSPSGAGKTSLIQAALIPRLLKMKFQVLPIVRINLDLSDAAPDAPNANAEFNRYVFSALLSLEEGLPAGQQSEHDRLKHLSLSGYLSHRPRPADSRDVEVLIFDQFEEMLTLDPTDQTAKREFFRQLGTALEETRRWVLFSMREDFVAALDQYALPVPSRFGNRFRLDLLGIEAAQQAIQQPAQQADVEFQDNAAQKLVNDLRRVRVQQPDGTLEPQLGPYIEPMQLQVVCHRLWETNRADSSRITVQDLSALETIDQSLVDQSLSEYYAQRVSDVAAESSVRERSIREWFDQRLLTEQGVRGTVLMGQERSGDLANRAVQLLVDAYLVRGEKRGGATWFELSHDRLIGPVREDNAAWFKANLSLLQRRSDVWVQQSRPESLLLRDQELAQANRWAVDHQADMLPAEVDFLSGSREQAQRALRLKRRNQAIVALGAVALALGTVAVVLAVLVLNLYRQASTARDAAEREARAARAGQLAAQSSTALEESPARSMLLAVEAVEAVSTTLSSEPHPASAEEALRAALKDPHGLLLGGHTQPVNKVVYSPDGRWLATASDDKSVFLLDATAASSPTLAFILSEHDEPVVTLAFGSIGPDGHLLATGSKDGTIRLWDVLASNPIATMRILKGHTSAVQTLAFSPDGRWLASGDLDGTARQWDMRAANPATTAIALNGHTGAVWSVAFSPDGHWLVTGSADGTVRLWDVNTSDPTASVRVLRGHKAGVGTLAFSPDGQWLATGSRDHTAMIWHMRAADPTSHPISLPGHADVVTVVKFSPDGHWLATGSQDATARMWDMRAADPATHAMVLWGHKKRVTDLAFSPNGRWLASGSVDNTVRLWDLNSADPTVDSQVLRGHDDAVRTLAFSPDGRQLVSGSNDATARVWRIDSPDPDINPQLLRGQADQINALAFSPAGQWLVTAGGDRAKRSNDNAVRLWNMKSADAVAPLVLRGHENWIQVAAFSPVGQWLATGGGDATARLWDMRATDPASHSLVLRGHAAFISALTFSSDGRWLVTGSQDKTVRLWDLRASDPTTHSLIFGGLEDRVNALAFSPDGRWLAAANGYETRLWDLSTTDPSAHPMTLTRHSDFVLSLSFSPDGHWLATGSADRTIIRWNMRAADPQSSGLVLRGHEDQVNILAFSPDGHWLASGGADKTARLWDMRAADPNAHSLPLRGHGGSIDALAFSADGHWLATAGQDAKARLWNLRAVDPVANSVSLIGHDGAIAALAFSPDNRWLATGGQDHIARLWLIDLDELVRMACRSAGRNFTQEEWRTFFPGISYRKTCPQWSAAR